MGQTREWQSMGTLALPRAVLPGEPLVDILPRLSPRRSDRLSNKGFSHGPTTPLVVSRSGADRSPRTRLEHCFSNRASHHDWRLAGRTFFRCLRGAVAFLAVWIDWDRPWVSDPRNLSELPLVLPGPRFNDSRQVTVALHDPILVEPAGADFVRHRRHCLGGLSYAFPSTLLFARTPPHTQLTPVRELR